MIKVIAPWIFKLPLLNKVGAFVLGRIGFFKHEPSRTLWHHEMIHQEQMDRHGIFKFYVIYVWDYIKLRIKGHNHWNAYMRIPFEVEAYRRENEWR